MATAERSSSALEQKLHTAQDLSTEAFAYVERAALYTSPVFLWRHGVERDTQNTQVLPIPGLGCSQNYLEELSSFLRRNGSQPHRLEITNIGSVGQTMERIVDKLRQIKSATGRGSILLGHSLGGAFATLVAQEEPELVGGVITLGTPFGIGRYIHPKVEEYASANIPEDDSFRKLVRCLDSAEQPPGNIPIHCISARGDRVAVRGTCHPYATDCTEVDSTHLGLIWSPDAFKIIAEKISENAPGMATAQDAGGRATPRLRAVA